MTLILEVKQEALRAARWTDEQAVAFARTLATFRDSIPPRRRDAVTAIVTAAGEAAQRGVPVYLVVIAIIGVLIHGLTSLPGPA